jgi:hypothetical protein
MTRDEAEQRARERLQFLADRCEEQGGNNDGTSCMEVGYAALGLAVCGDTAALDKINAVTIRFNGIGENVDVARRLLTK